MTPSETSSIAWAIPASRGLILDRRGRVLVDNEPAFQLELIPEQTPDLADTLQRLARLKLLDPDDIPSSEEAALSPTELPFTSEDFDPQLEQALELFPEILTVEGAGIRHAINGLLSLTPDGMPMLGETEVKNLWSAAAVWIK